jgi:hypothetical protein
LVKKSSSKGVKKQQCTEQHAKCITLCEKQKGKNKAQCQWLTSVILATQQAEIRRIEVRSQPPAKKLILGNPISKIPNMKKGWWSGSRCRP